MKTKILLRFFLGFSCTVAIVGETIAEDVRIELSPILSFADQDFIPVAWDWFGDTIIGTTPGARRSRRSMAFSWRLDEENRKITVWPTGPGRHSPFLVDEKHALLFGDGEWLLFSIADNKVIKRVKVDHGWSEWAGFGGPQRATLGHGCLWYTAWNEMSEMFVLCLSDFSVHSLGPGSSPFSPDRKMLYFIENSEMARVMCVELGASFERTGPPKHIFANRIRQLRIIPGRSLFVCQRNVGVSTVELVDFNGRLIRSLSAHHHIGKYPQVSPSGKYIAFLQVPYHGEEGRGSVTIVDLDGNYLHSREIRYSSMGNRFRWSRFDDELAIIDFDHDMKHIMHIVRIKKPVQ